MKRNADIGRFTKPSMRGVRWKAQRPHGVVSPSKNGTTPVFGFRRRPSTGCRAPWNAMVTVTGMFFPEAGGSCIYCRHRSSFGPVSRSDVERSPQGLAEHAEILSMPIEPASHHYSIHRS